MSAVEILIGATEPIGIRFRRGAAITTGATVRARVLRTSDGKELDWSTSTFVTAGTAVQPRQALTETPAASGAYEFAWNTSTITNPTTPDTYLVEYDQTAPVVRAFIRQSEVRVRASQSISAAVVAAPAAVWSTAVPDSFGAGTAGFVLGTNLNATVSSRAVPGDAMTLTAGERTAVGTAVWASATRTLTAGAITSATFATDAVDANAFAQGAADKAWSTTTRTLSSGAITSATFSTDAIDSNALAASAASEIGAAVWATATRTITGTTSGAITSASFAAGALGAVWDELTAAHAVTGSFGLLVGTDLDAAVSSRATNAGAASSVWSTLVPGAFGAGSAGFVLGTNLDAAVSSRSTLTQTQIVSDATPFLGSRIDAAISSRSAPGDAMTLTVGERAAVGTAVWASATRTLTAGAITSTTFSTDALDSNALAASAAVEVAGKVWDELVASHSIAGSFGLLVGTDLDAAVSSRATDAGAASAVWSTAVPGAFAAGTAGFNVDAQVSSRSTLTALGVWSEPLPGAYGAGQAGFNLDARVTSRATDSSASAAVWGAAVRTLTSVVLDSGSLTAAAIGSGYVAAVQSGLATSAQVPGLVWDEPIAGHSTAGTAGKFLIDAQAGSDPDAMAAAVWATPEGAGTMGASLALLRRRTTNRRRVDAGGVVTFYDDVGAPERAATLTDVNGGPIVVVPGDPADSTAEV